MTTCCSAARATTSSTAAPATNIVIDSLRGTTLTSATFAGEDWLTAHVRTVNGKPALVVGGKVRTLPYADPIQLALDAARV